MGILKSQFGGMTKIGRLFRFYFLLLVSVQNVAPKSFYSTSQLNSTDIFTETKNVVTNIIQLDLVHDPEYVWEVKKDDSETKRFTRSEASKSFKIALHLKNCNFGWDEHIEIKNFDNVIHWYCPQIGTTSVNYFFDDYTSNKIHVSEEKPEFALEAIDNLDEVSITPNFTFEENKSSEWKAIIVVNLYKDEVNGCWDRFFDCELRRSINCCSGEKQNPKRSRTPRCIPNSLKCNQNPNCGKSGTNNDETTETCFPEKLCNYECPSLTWKDFEIFTILAIVFAFIIIPAVIVFGIFYYYRKSKSKNTGPLPEETQSSE